MTERLIPKRKEGDERQPRPLVTLMNGTPERRTEVLAAQSKRIRGMLDADQTGQGRVVVLISNTNATKEYAELVKFYSHSHTLTQAELLSACALEGPPEARRELTLASITSIPQRQLHDITEKVIHNRSQDALDERRAINDIMTSYPGRVKIVYEWQDTDVLDDTRATKKVTGIGKDPLTLGAINRRKRQTLAQAEVQTRKNAHVAALVAEAMDDPTIIGGVARIQYREALMMESVYAKSEQADTSQIVREVVDPIGEEDMPYHPPLQDVLVAKAVAGTMTDQDVKLTLLAEAHKVDLEEHELTPQLLLAEKFKWMEEERERQTDSSHTLLVDATRQYIAMNGLWDPSEDEIAAHLELVKEKVQLFEDFWETQIINRTYAILERDGVQTPDENQSSAARMEAEEAVVTTMNTMIHANVTDVNSLGANFFLAVLREPYIIAGRAEAYDTEHNGSVENGLRTVVMDVAENMGHALPIHYELRRDRPTDWLPDETPEQRELRLRDNKLRYLTGKYLHALGIQEPGTSTILEHKEQIRNQLTQSELQWEDIISGKAEYFLANKELYGEMTRHEAQLQAEEEVLTMVNTIGTSAFTEVDEIGFAVLKISLEDPVGVAAELRRYAERDPSLSVDGTVTQLEREATCPAVITFEEEAAAFIDSFGGGDQDFGFDDVAIADEPLDSVEEFPVWDGHEIDELDKRDDKGDIA